MDKVRIADMMKLQNDNFNLLGKEVLAWLLPEIDSLAPQTESPILDYLSKWDYFNDPDSKGAIAFELYWESLYNLTWDEFNTENESLTHPSFYYTNRFLASHVAHPLFSHDSLDIKDKKSLLLIALKQAEARYLALDEAEQNGWAAFKATKARHWARIDAFHSDELLNGGNKHIVNATSSTHGPSWRMIVHLKKDQIEAYGIYPGGQSGNPASEYYTNYNDMWSKGKYLRLNFITDNTQTENLTTVNYYPADQ